MAYYGQDIQGKAARKTECRMNRICHFGVLFGDCLLTTTLVNPPKVHHVPYTHSQADRDSILFFNQGPRYVRDHQKQRHHTLSYLLRKSFMVLFTLQTIVTSSSGRKLVTGGPLVDSYRLFSQEDRTTEGKQLAACLKVGF